MQQETADKLVGGQGHLPWLLVILWPVLFILERHLAVVYIQQALIADGDTMGITAQIVDNLLWTAEWGLGNALSTLAPIDDPFALPERSHKSPEFLGLGELGERPVEGQSLFDERLIERFQKQAAEEASQHADTEKETGPAVDPA